MPKPRPTPDLEFVLHPARDAGYKHFENHAAHPFIADATTLGRRNAWWLAEAALLAYWDAPTVLARLRDAGMDGKPLDTNGLQGFVSWSDRFVIVAFRGTEPDSWEDIFADAQLLLVPHRNGTRVHKGFKKSLERVWPALSQQLHELSRTRSVWFTGHSLGAALAILAADLFETARGVCTIGCPRVGDAAFSLAFDARFSGRSLRYVNDADIVTHVPPPLPGRYDHVPALRHIRADGSIENNTPLLNHFFPEIIGDPLHMLDVVKALLSGVFRTAPKALLDHMPRAYTVDIWNDYEKRGN